MKHAAIDTKRACLALVGILCAMLCGVTSGCESSLGEDIRWSKDGIEHVGTLHLPEGDGPFPLAIFVQGSGCMPRTERAVRSHASRLNDLGIAAFAYDKRGCGDSGGNWRDVGIEPLADDVLAVLDRLAGHERVDSERIGMMGLSQGAWVSLITAKKDERIAFVVWLSGPPMTPAEQGSSIVRMAMARSDATEQETARALELDQRILDVYRTDSGWSETRELVQAATSEPWFAAAGIGLQPRESWNWRWYASFMDYDPRQSLESLEVPMLAIFGEHDELVPAAESAAAIDAFATTAPSARQTVLLSGVGHRLMTPDRRWPDQYWSELERFFREIGVIRPDPESVATP